MKILIVENDALVALSLTYALEDAGHIAVGPAASSVRALELTADHSPDLALVDLSLRNAQDGVMLAQVLQEKFSVPSLFTTAQAQVARKNAGFARGIIIKPYHPDTVVKAIEMLFSPSAGDLTQLQDQNIELFD